MGCSVLLSAVLVLLLSSSIFVFFRGNADHLTTVEEADKVTLPDQPRVVDFEQYGNYITVDEKHQRKLFYYFVESTTDPASKPLVLWLNGGPGCSSIGQGAFTEHGPFKPTAMGLGLVENPYSWNRVANMLYLDSPRGVGFSYSANSSDYYLVNDEMTARDNMMFLLGWFSKFPKYQNSEFFITGESYAGHYAPQLAQLILQTQPNIKLKGIMIGNPLLDFDTDFNSRAEYLWSHGLISDSTYSRFTKACNFATYKRQKRIGNISTICSDVYHEVVTSTSRFIDTFDVTSDVCLDFLQAHRLLHPHSGEKMDVCLEDHTAKYLNRQDVQKALHSRVVGMPYWSTCSSVMLYDFQNLENPTLSLLGTLVKAGVRVLAYSGDQDSFIPLTGTRTLVKGLAEDLGLNTTEVYRVWFDGKQVAGWTEVYGGFLSFATIRGAAHAAPFSQPERLLVLFKSFVEGKSPPTS